MGTHGIDKLCVQREYMVRIDCVLKVDTWNGYVCGVFKMNTEYGKTVFKLNIWYG